ncbi:unnamed protein product [Cuscuta europaea]|uniref:Uncharacterized protein n=1 Tax=Cuscuta europaea TaxID=41803 RepID=A0A9P0YXY2_CUSEU|nr:unnamed protein product [Cuscuta europaea]
MFGLVLSWSMAGLGYLSGSWKIWKTGSLELTGIYGSEG